MLVSNEQGTAEESFISSPFLLGRHFSTQLIGYKNYMYLSLYVALELHPYQGLE